MFSSLSLSWRQRDSNPRPLRCERNALPAELCPRPNCYHYSTTGMNCKQRIKKTETLVNQRLPFFSSRAADGNRTRDLRTTNATHYRLCYSSLFSCLRLLATVKYTTITPRKCQLLFSSFFCFLISTFNSVFDAQFHRPEHRLPQRHSESQYRPSSGWRQCSHTSLLPGG